MNTNEIWNNVLNNISKKVSPLSYTIWFKELKLYSLKENKAIIVSNTDDFNKEQFIKNLITNYYSIIKENLDLLTDANNELEFLTEKQLQDSNYTNNNDQLEIIEYEDNNVSKDYDMNNYKYYNNFNPEYTFETFVVGDSNRLAYGTAKAVAQKPGKIYNPFFIHGKSGLGKTHLMHAIGNYIVNNSDLNVLYITAEQFMNDYISIIKYTKGNNVPYIESFRNKYRNIDVLMIDDIQFLNTGPKTQTEFTNTFNALYDNDKQIIIASDTSVKDIENLADRLKTRFLGGLTEAISPPDINLKKEIIKNKIQLYNYNINIDEETIEYIATKCGSDIRTLQGAVLRLVAYKATFGYKEINIETAKEALIEYTIDNKPLYRNTTVSNIIDIVAKYYNLEPSYLKGKMRKKEIVHARSIAIYLSRMKTHETVERIGLEFGGKDHSTIVYWTNIISEELKTNMHLANDINILSDKICE